MTTATTTRVRPGEAGRVLALMAAEVRLVVRNRTLAISSLLLPIAFGVFVALTFDPGGRDMWATIVALQLVMTLTMSVYMTITQAVVARRQSRVLKRMRTSSMTDTVVLLAITGPGAAVALLHLVVYALIDLVLGAPVPDPLPLLVVVGGGLAMCVTAAFATANVTSSPERAQITTMPLFLLMFAAAFVLPLVPVDSPLQALVLVPGAPIGQLTQLAFTGGTWAPGLLGLPALLPAVVSLAGWTVAFAVLARRSFRWDPRAV